MTSGSVHKRKDKKGKKRRNKKKKKYIRSARVEDTGVNYGGSGDEINLDEELHPIGYYINDKGEMINQMFSVIKPHKLRAMLPPILKESSMEELKAYCLDELLGMSWKRINSVLEGRELDSSSESDDESIITENDCKSVSSSPCGTDTHWSNEEEKSEVQEAKPEETYVTEDRSGPGNDMDTLEIGITNEEMGELLSCVPLNQQNERKRPSEDQGTSAPSNKTRKWKLKRPKSLDIVNKTMKDSEDDKNESIENNTVGDKCESESEDNAEENEGIAYRDIIELEMRARAIRALLKQQAGAGDGDEAGCSTAASEHISKPQMTVSEFAEKSPGSNPVKKLQSSIPDVNKVSFIDVIAKPIRKKLKRNMVKPPQSANKKILLDRNVPDTMQNTEFRNKDINKDVEEVVCVSSPLHATKKSVSSSRMQPVPYFQSKKKNEMAITYSKRTENKRIFLKDREDGELSTDGEKSSDAVIETHPESGSSDIIILDDSEDDLLDPSPQKNVTSNIINVGETEETNLLASEFTKQKKSSSGYKETRKSNAVDDKVEFKVSVKDNPSEKQYKNDECMDVSWAARWLQSKGVQKVVSTSKMCGKIRNRMKSAQKEKKVSIKTPQQEIANKQSLVIEGSVNEYNMLDKPKSNQKESCAESGKKNTDVV